MNIFKRILNKVRIKNYHLKRFIKYEKNNKVEIPLKNRIKYNLKGFSSANVVYYNLQNNKTKNYLSEWQRLNKAIRINQKHKSLMRNKIMFHCYFRNNPDVVPPLAYILEGKLISHKDKLPIYLEQFLDSLNGDIILKPNDNDRGEGIEKICIEDNDIRDKINRLIQNHKNYVIQKIIKQDGFCGKVNPTSVNTIRVLVLKDPKNQEHFIARAVQRFGTKKSDFLDNWSAGGMSVGIDIEKDIYKKGAIRKNGKLSWVSNHPDTNTRFEGVKVENWLDIKRMVIQASKEMFFVKYIGWDIIPMKDKAIILEANNNCNIDLLQTHEGLLTDDRIANFYRSNKVIA